MSSAKSCFNCVNNHNGLCSAGVCHNFALWQGTTIDPTQTSYLEQHSASCDTIESLRQQLAECQATNGKLREALDDATTSLETIQLRSYGEESYLDSKVQMRGYAGIRAGVARESLALPNDATALNELIAERTRIIKEEFERECNDVDWLLNRLGFAGDNFRTDGGSLRLQMLVELFEQFMSERMKTQKEYYESVFQDGANRIAELNAEVERLKGEQYVQLDIHTDDTRTKQQRELDGTMEVGQLLADSENSTASNSAFKGTDHLTWVHTGNGYISDSSGRFIGTFSGDFRNRDRFICAVNSENQLRQQNAELTAQRDAAMKDAERYRKARKTGVAKRGQSDLIIVYNERADEAIDAAIANCK